REQLVGEVLRDLTEARSRGDRVRVVADGEHGLELLVRGLGALPLLREPLLEALLRLLGELVVLLLVLRLAVTEVQVLRELDVEELLELDVRLRELADREVVASAAGRGLVALDLVELARCRRERLHGLA